MSDFQSTFSTYNGSSMLSVFQPGDGLKVEPYQDVSEIETGDVITYTPPGEKFYVVHRVVEIKNTGTHGEVQVTIQTQGDNNDERDPYKLKFSDIEGKVTEIKRGRESLPVKNGRDGICSFNYYHKKKRRHLLLAFIFRPLYNIIAATGWFSGLYKIESVTFNRPEGSEFQLLHNGRSIGQRKVGSEIWEINFPYRLFVNEAKLPGIENGPVKVFCKHISKISFPMFFALCLFYFISFQILFPILYISLQPTRVNIFAGLFCFLSALFAIFAKRHEISKTFSKTEILSFFTFIFLLLISIYFGGRDIHSIYRAVTLFTSISGGYICSKLLLKTTFHKLIFYYFAMLILLLILVLGISGYIYYGEINYFLEYTPALFQKSYNEIKYYMSVHLHYWIDLLLLLSTIPLSSIIRKRKHAVLCGTIILGLSYCFFLLSRLRSAMLLPFLALPALFAYQSSRRKKIENNTNSTLRSGELNPLCGIKKMVMIAVVLTLGVFCFIQLYPEKINNLSLKHGSIAYRLENYPFSYYIAEQHPISGIGLRAPRMIYLRDYNLRFQHLSPEYFQYQVESIVTSENIFLSMLAGLGFPITILAIIILFKIMKNLWLTPTLGYRKRYIFHPYALFISLLLVLLNSFLYDSFLFPQVSWYFGIMLGFIPKTKKQKTN